MTSDGSRCNGLISDSPPAPSIRRWSFSGSYATTPYKEIPLTSTYKLYCISACRNMSENVLKQLYDSTDSDYEDFHNLSLLNLKKIMSFTHRAHCLLCMINIKF